MKHKFVIMVASLLLAFVLVTTVIWGVAFTSEITERGVEYAGQMTETANRNVESYLKKLRLIAFVLQNNYLAKPILNKTFYEDDSERLTDMRNMQLLLKAVMTGADEISAFAQKEDRVVIRLGNRKALLMKMTSEVTGWQSIVLIPYEQISGQHSRMLSINAVVLVLLSLAAVILCRILANRFLKNIEILTDAVGSIQKDNLYLDISIHSGDEAEVLYHRFEDMISRIKEQIADMKKHEKEKRFLTLRALQAQINPHFLYNSLNTIKWMGQMQGADSIVDAVNALSSIMQVNMSKNTYLTFQEELDYLNKYVCMKEFQKAARIKFVCKIEEGLRQCYILKMLVQPIVENSLKHGEVMEREDGYISVSIYSDGEDVQIDVEDNGKG